MILSYNKNLSALLGEIRAKHNGDFHFLNCLHLFRTENKLKLREKVCENEDFRGLKMFCEENVIRIYT